jgi:hypothetical protein
MLAVPKADSGAGKLRMCANLSAAVGAGEVPVNASTDYAALYPCDLASVPGFITSALYLRGTLPVGEVVHASKLDAQAFFRQLRCSARDRWRVAHVFDDQLFLHNRFSFGGAASPMVACTFSNAICDVVARRFPGVRWGVFVDDFLQLGSRAAVERAVVSLRELFRELGVIENVGKYVAATPRLTLLGVEFDFARSTASVTARRRARLCTLIDEVLGIVRDARREALGSVVGRLLAVLGGNFAFIQALFPLSPVFSSHVWAATAALRDKAGPRAVRWDAVAWGLEAWKTLLAPGAPANPSFALVATPTVRGGTFIEIHTDSSDEAFAGIMWPHGLYFAEAWWPTEVGPGKLTSNTREAWACTIACLLFAQWWHEAGARVVLLRSDSMTSCCAFAACRCDDARLFQPLLWLCRVQWRWGVRVLPLHLRGSSNKQPDFYSRTPAAAALHPAHRRLSVPAWMRKLPMTSLASSPSFPSPDLLPVLPETSQPSSTGGSASGPKASSASLAHSMRSMPATFMTRTRSGPPSSFSC